MGTRIDLPRRKESEKTSSDDLKPSMTLWIVLLVMVAELVTMAVKGSTSLETDELGKDAMGSIGR